jgi:hypothetical protein
MVYRDLSTDSAAQMFDELTAAKNPPPAPPAPKQKTKKVVKVALPKS